MATVVVEAEPDPSCSIPNPASPTPSLSHRFLDSKFYLLVVIGELVTEEHLRRAIGNIERGKVPGPPREQPFCCGWEARGQPQVAQKSLLLSPLWRPSPPSLFIGHKCPWFGARPWLLTVCHERGCSSQRPAPGVKMLPSLNHKEKRI